VYQHRRLPGRQKVANTYTSPDTIKKLITSFGVSNNEDMARAATNNRNIQTALFYKLIDLLAHQKIDIKSIGFMPLTPV
jgi:hypothetical protein